MDMTPCGNKSWSHILPILSKGILVSLSMVIGVVTAGMAFAGTSSSSNYQIRGSGQLSATGSSISNNYVLEGRLGQGYSAAIHTSSNYVLQPGIIPVITGSLDTDTDGIADVVDDDDDNDGMPDSYEESFGFDPKDASDAQQDADKDGDGESNLDEYRNGTDPLNPSSSMRSRSAVISVINLLTE